MAPKLADVGVVGLLLLPLAATGFPALIFERIFLRAAFDIRRRPRGACERLVNREEGR